MIQTVFYSVKAFNYTLRLRSNISLFYCYVIYFLIIMVYIIDKKAVSDILKQFQKMFSKTCKHYIIILFSSSGCNDSNGIIIFKFNFSIYILYIILISIHTMKYSAKIGNAKRYNDVGINTYASSSL